MSEPSIPPGAGAARPLAGARCWAISDGRAGMLAQLRGVAAALGVEPEMKTLVPRGLYKVMAPWGPLDPAVRFGAPGSLFAPPWPTIALATGRASVPYVRALKREAGAAVFTVVLLDPRAGTRIADLIWVPQHDRLRGANVMATLTSPHPFSPERLAELRRSMPPQIAALPQPRIAVILGGRNGSYSYGADDERRLAASLRALAGLGAAFMITPSRRSHSSLVAAVEAATRGAPRILWTGEGDNPYPQFLAHADAFVVTADSVNMTGEAAVTGKPVYVFEPTGGNAKFHRFHAALREAGITRALPVALAAWETWSYQPLYSAAAIAGEIERRWSRRAGLLPGLVGARRGEGSV